MEDCSKHLCGEEKIQSPVREVLGQTVKAARIARGLTQAQLASRMRQLANAPSRFRQGSISSIERGTRCPSLDALLLLAQALEVPVASLLDGAGIGSAPKGPEGEQGMAQHRAVRPFP